MDLVLRLSLRLLVLSLGLFLRLLVLRLGLLLLRMLLLCWLVICLAGVTVPLLIFLNIV